MPQADIYIASLLLIYHIFWYFGFVNFHTCLFSYLHTLILAYLHIHAHLHTCSDIPIIATEMETPVPATPGGLFSKTDVDVATPTVEQDEYGDAR